MLLRNLASQRSSGLPRCIPPWLHLVKFPVFPGLLSLAAADVGPGLRRLAGGDLLNVTIGTVGGTVGRLLLGRGLGVIARCNLDQKDRVEDKTGKVGGQEVEVKANLLSGREKLHSGASSLAEGCEGALSPLLAAKVLDDLRSTRD